MSDKYIEKEDAIQSIIAHDLVGGDARGWAEYLLENASTVDVAPVRHGRWINCEWVESGFKFWRCSECNHDDMNSRLHKYCPNCGAKMDE